MMLSAYCIAAAIFLAVCCALCVDKTEDDDDFDGPMRLA